MTVREEVIAEARVDDERAGGVAGMHACESSGQSGRPVTVGLGPLSLRGGGAGDAATEASSELDRESEAAEASRSIYQFNLEDFRSETFCIKQSQYIIQWASADAVPAEVQRTLADAMAQ